MMDRYGMRQPWGASINTPSRLEKVVDGEWIKYESVAELEEINKKLGYWNKVKVDKIAELEEKYSDLEDRHIGLHRECNKSKAQAIRNMVDLFRYHGRDMTVENVLEHADNLEKDNEV